MTVKKLLKFVLIILAIGGLSAQAAMTNSVDTAPTRYWWSGNPAKDFGWNFLKEAETYLEGTAAVQWFYVGPRSAVPSTVAEGVIYYDSDDDTLRVYANGVWADLTAGASGVTDLDTAYNGGAAVTVDGNAITLTVTNTSNNRGLDVVQNDTTNNPEAVRLTNTGSGDTLAFVSTGGKDIDGTGSTWSVTSAGAATFSSIAQVGISATTLVSTGVTTLGDNSTTVAINSSGWDITTAGAITGITTLSMTDDLTLATGKAIKGSTTTAETIAIQVYDNDTGPAYKNAILLTNGNTPAIAIGDNNPTVAINSSDWDISTTGAMTGIGAITMDGLLTGTLGSTITGAAVNLNASSNFAVNIGTGTTNVQVTIGAGTAPFAVDSTAFDVSNTGAVSGVTTLSMSDDLSLANGKAIKGTTTTGNTIKLQSYDNDTGPAYKDALTITNGNTPGISLGGNTNTVAVDSTDWDIDATGAMTGIGAIAMDGLLTGTLGATVTGAAINLNASSNFAVNIGTGTTNVQVTIGAGTAPFAVDSTAFDVSNAGAVSGVTTLVMSGQLTASGDIVGDGGDQLTGYLQTIDNDADGKAAGGVTIAMSRTIFTNAGAVGAGTWVLPEASTAIGVEFTFVVIAAQNLVIDPADGTDYIRALTNAAGDSITSAAIGDSVTLVAVDANNWVGVATSKADSWADTN